MEIVKKNLVSIVCGVVALIAVIAVLWPINSKFADLQQDVDKRKGVYDALNALDTKQRTLPVTTLDGAAAAPLQRFPTHIAIDAAKEATDKLKAESGHMLAEAVKLNQRTPLVPGALPQSADQLPQINFRTEYQRMIEFMNGDVGGSSFVWTVLKAGLPPTEADITRTREARKAAIEGQYLKYGRDNLPMNAAEVAQKVTDEQNKVPDQLRNKSATESKIYINADALDEYPGLIKSTNAPEPRDIFLAQIGLWIQQDIAAAIAETNASSANVLEAPIKHLIKIDIPDDPFLHGAPIVGGVAGTPAMPVSDIDAGMAPPDAIVDPGAVSGVIDPTISILTKRKAGPIYDIATFRVVMNVDGTRVPEILATLARNRFITAQEIQMQSVDPSTPLVAGYLYGKQPIVTLTLRCEQLFLREWLKPLMPQRIKALLGVPATP